MKTGKKLLALLLAVVMTMSLLTVGAFAEETPSSETPLEQQDSGSGNIPDDPAEGPADDLTGNSEDGAAGESDAALTLRMWQRSTVSSMKHCRLLLTLCRAAARLN